MKNRNTIPRVSVLMSVYNTPRDYLKEAIDSVLNQTFDDFEFIIVDDNSNKETKDVLRNYTYDNRIILIENNSNLGLTKNLNKALSLAKGEYVARMDADDICDKTRFEKQVSYLDSNESVAMAATYYYLFDSSKKNKHKNEGTSPIEVKTSLFFSNSSIMHSSVMMRHAIFNTESGFCYDETYTKTQDFDLWARASHFVKIAVVPEYLMFYRLSDKQVSRVSSSEQISLKEKVLIRQLYSLMEKVDDKNFKLHCRFCIGEKVDSSKIVINWAKTLIKKNRDKNYYPDSIFNYFVAKRTLKSAIKSIRDLADCFIIIRVLGFYLKSKILFCTR